MNPCTRLVPLAAVLPFALVPAPVAFAPAEGTTWTKTFEATVELEWGSLRVWMGGSEVPADFLPEFELEVSDTTRLVVTDEYAAVADGRPTRLRRTFDTAEREVGQSFEMVGMDGSASEDGSGDGTSPLEGATVEFTWDADEEEYVAAWVDDDRDGDLLDDLVEDTDFRGLLPEEEIEVGDSWTVASEVFGRLGKPGGELAIELQGEGIDDFEDYGAGEPDVFEGELELRLARFREEDGVRVAVIEIEGSFVATSEREDDLDQVPVADGEATTAVETKSEAEGVLLWNLSAGLLHSLDVTSDMTITSVTTKNEGQPGPEYHHTQVMVGTSTFTVSGAPAE